MKWVDFKRQQAVAFELFCGKVSDGLVEKQGLIVGHKECRCGFVCPHLWCHVGLFVLANVGWIGDNEVVLRAVIGIFGSQEGVLEHEIHLCAQAMCIRSCGEQRIT